MTAVHTTPRGKDDRRRRSVRDDTCTGAEELHGTLATSRYAQKAGRRAGYGRKRKLRRATQTTGVRGRSPRLGVWGARPPRVEPMSTEKGARSANRGTQW